MITFLATSDALGWLLLTIAALHIWRSYQERNDEAKPFLVEWEDKLRAEWPFSDDDEADVRQALAVVNDRPMPYPKLKAVKP